MLIRPRLLDALRRLNPGVPAEYLQQAVAEIAAPKSQDAIAENHRIHDYLVAGYPLSYIDADGVEQNPRLRLLGTADVPARVSDGVPVLRTRARQ